MTLVPVYTAGWIYYSGRLSLLKNYGIQGYIYVDSNYLDIVTYQFIICLDYVLRTSIDLMNVNGFHLAKERSRR